ncbi:hypothetical protein [Natranaeroarchaeum aerophilus]|uniref:Uncharacterized protein n=1 Tax=Natranaeroarchaeum aerophilus TaxID=2917711 RepID=A0AAE3FQ36_9EURY|nr:hypothetical protein [Natranaeroarchaeum aerophilus]MCL9813577.1 hypothetical protein [Natranaeroarchaeum aerophilus]
MAAADDVPAYLGGVVAMVAILGLWRLLTPHSFPGLPGVVGIFLVPAAVAVLIATVFGRIVRRHRERVPERNTGLGDGLRELVVLRQDEDRRLLAATVAYLLCSYVLLVPTIVTVLTAVLAVDTVVSYAGYAAGIGLTLPPVLYAPLLLGTITASSILALAPARFYDLAVLDGDVSPWSAWRPSVIAARKHPVTICGYALVSFGLVAVPVGIFWVAWYLLDPLVAGVIVVPLGGFSLSAAAAVHSETYERVVRPAVRATASTDDVSSERTTRAGEFVISPLIEHRARFALVIILVLGVLVGASTIRALDVRPDEGPTPEPIDGEADAATLIENAAEYTLTTNHRWSSISPTNASSTDGETEEWTAVIDHDNRKEYFAANFAAHEAEGDWRRAYVSSGTSAKYPGGNFMVPDCEQPVDDDPGVSLEFQRCEDGWFVAAEPGIAADSHVGLYAFPDDPAAIDWERTERADGMIELEATGEDVPMAVWGGVGPANDTVHENHYTVTIDSETGLATEIQWAIRMDDGEMARSEARFEEYTTATVDRPDELGDPSVAERLWSVIYY